MVSIREATEKASTFAREVLDPEQTRSVRLEEVESTTVDGEDAWLITLSMTIPEGEGIFTTLGGPKRQYKSFTVLKRNGEVKSMKIRSLADA